MFTGIITDIGKVLKVDASGETEFTIATSYAHSELWIGQSICCSGACLTVIKKGVDSGVNWFSVQASNETLNKTTLGNWREGTRINLEKALKASDDLSGHIVTGHVDGVAEIAQITPDGESFIYLIDAPAYLAPLIAAKGSVTLDGTSLTVNSVTNNRFSITLIPHTHEVTSWADRKAGDTVNLEVDIIARYVERLLEMRK